MAKGVIKLQPVLSRVDFANKVDWTLIPCYHVDKMSFSLIWRDKDGYLGFSQVYGFEKISDRAS